MAVPKKKTSVSRKGLRRAGQTHKLYANNVVVADSTTGELTKKGCISPSGYWKGKQIFTTKADREETTEE
ncbi:MULTISPECIES: 50S ribosomal protein L32 [Halobacteriovorax]|uniref:Large ribosomal subunit protein bL32 n=1 Tax=Halobacteriovorax vibrionivorans TaxID=2152716 RepID=A0ABY0IHH7_9BACT|nr:MULTISPECIES: 50S ribosomal protein L32 [Halobacteriovorax]AYF43495.1 ribosomal protein L32 [Halobacteriovorax sp. BALOs_7]RZF21935.1 50S ribosomal protein L32 [Halobacteriovorax vibrionivorans]TGD47223.1 50S ribosomal protein L32 [Halobacteriovorax sp. Y22]